MALGLEDGPRRDELVALLRARGELPPRIRLLRRSEPTLGERAPLEKFLREEIARRGAGEDLGGDVLSMLRLERSDDGEPMGVEELCDQLITFLLAASETTSSGLAWAFDLLLRHPAALERLKAELAEGREDYLRAVVKETLRLRPPVPYLDRVVREEPYPLGGYVLRPGTHIRASVATVHYDPDLYPEPFAFRPERFLEGEAVDESVWLPVGAGVRRCLGASFAPFEIRIVIRRVLERTSLSPAGRQAEKAAPLGFTLTPARGTRVIKEAGLGWA
jgi:cytochrome P450